MGRRTLRDGCRPSEVFAHNVLDRVAAGQDVPEQTIRRALATLGDL